MAKKTIFILSWNKISSDHHTGATTINMSHTTQPSRFKRSTQQPSDWKMTIQPHMGAGFSVKQDSGCLGQLQSAIVLMNFISRSKKKTLYKKVELEEPESRTQILIPIYFIQNTLTQFDIFSLAQFQNNLLLCSLMLKSAGDKSAKGDGRGNTHFHCTPELRVRP